MKVSLNWLRDYVELPADLTAEQIAHDLTLSTVEVEGVEDIASLLDKIVVGKVIELKSHPDADKLQIAITDIGSGVHEIVCGGSNLAKDMLVAVAPPGAKVRWHGEGDLIELKESKVRGVLSYGMICAASEIGLADLFPTEDDREIIDLTGVESEAGQPLAKALKLDDVIIEIDNKSLTNRPDLWGHYGIARELSAIYSLALKPLPEISLPTPSGDFKVQIKSDKCMRYTATTASGVQVVESPDWIKSRLASVGQRSIDLIVDLTNYVMFAVGQPLHAFDAEQVSEIEVREAKDGEILKLLDGSELKLDSSMLVIADDSKPLALAGIMGGLDSGINKNTSKIVLETATFNSISVRRTAKDLSLRTESSMRFEKALDTDRAELATKMFFQILSELQGAVKVNSFTDICTEPTKPVNIEVSEEFIYDKVGEKLEIVEPLTRLGYQVKKEGEVLNVLVPSWRATGDVSLAVDLVEEVARLYGYDNLAFQPIPISLEKPVLQSGLDLERKSKEYLANIAGMYEVFNYPWVDEQYLEACNQNEQEYLALAAPPSPTSASLVQSLVPNILAVAKKNSHEFNDFAIFEVGNVFDANEKFTTPDTDESLPSQPRILCSLVASQKAKESFIRLKGALSGLFASLRVDNLRLMNSSTPPGWAARDACFDVYSGSAKVGVCALVSEAVRQNYAFNRGKFSIFEIDLSKLEARPGRSVKYQSLPRYPSVKYDLAVVFDNQVSWQEIEKVVSKTSKLITSVEFVDEYSGNQVPEDKKSIAFQMLLGKSSGTLTSEEVQSVADEVLARLNKGLSGELRTQ